MDISGPEDIGLYLGSERKIRKGMFGHIGRFFHPHSFLYETRKIYPLAAGSASSPTSFERRPRIISEYFFCSSTPAFAGRKTGQMTLGSKNGSKPTALVRGSRITL